MKEQECKQEKNKKEVKNVEFAKEICGTERKEKEQKKEKQC